MYRCGDAVKNRMVAEAKFIQRELVFYTGAILGRCYTE